MFLLAILLIILGFPSFPTLFSGSEDNLGFCTMYSYHVSLIFPSLTVFQSWCVMTLILLNRTSQVFCRMSFNLGLSNVFS